MNWFIDTNVLIYAIDNRFPAKNEQARLWLSELARHDHRVGGLIILNPFLTSPHDFLPAN
jgi:predicted nucleic acid-binding protein